MKLSDYVAQFLARQGIRHAFVVSGGASLHLIHSLDGTQGIDFVCTQHEQAAAMAADAYSRVTGNLGVAVATSGPGATNMVTGVCCAYYDSVPTIYITGQVATFRMKGGTGVRQIGFQETDALELYRPVTKYATQIVNADRIRFELEKACHLARSGRPGPVLVDIPDDVQRAEVDPGSLIGYPADEEIGSAATIHPEAMDRCLELVLGAKRPVIVLGWGVHLAKAEEDIADLLRILRFPVAPTWAAADLLPADDPLLIGTFGTHGTRHANFAVQNADLILSVGSRLDTKATGSPITTFARRAARIVVDIDSRELEKFKTFGLDVDLPIRADARDFLGELNARASQVRLPDLSDWLACIGRWKSRYPVCPACYFEEEALNPYVFVKRLSAASAEGDILILDTGCTLPWMMQAFEFKREQRLYHDWNNTAMGWALPASIAAALAHPDRRIICVTGDGSLQMNIQELATIIRHDLPIKIFLINNHGYSMIQQTQDQWLHSQYLASTVPGGLAFPDFVKVARAYGFKTLTIEKNRDVEEHISVALKSEEPFFANVEISSEHRVIPQVKFGRPNEDPAPLLDRQEFFENMVVEPMAASVDS